MAVKQLLVGISIEDSGLERVLWRHSFFDPGVDVVSVDSCGLRPSRKGVAALVLGFVGGRGERSFNAPTKFSKSIAKCGSTNVEPVAPVNHPECFAIERKKRDSARISGLLSARCPSAILRLVVSVIVDAFKRVLVAWPRPHVGKELLKTFPFLADRDSSPAVKTVWGASGICTPIAHCRPSPVLGSLGFFGWHRHQTV